MKQLDHRRRLIDSFVNAIYLFDDRLVITFNYKERTETITFADIEDVFGSDLSLLTAPKKQEIQKGVFCFFLVVEGLPNVHVKINKILDPQNTVFRFTFLGECVIMYTDQRQNTPQNESS